ncbi:siderophore-interacting protein [Rothia nasimurium]|uniref:siderophore-interacting protein n=1 Tax=Rothia nasimurium TaxID=85336 RepID=UPI001F2734AD|nr:siderophore-interacting protein [Rothia nasimurium]
MSKPRSSAPRPSTRRDVKRSINQYGVFPVTVSRVEQLTDSFVRVSLTGRSLLHAATPISDGTGQVYDAYIKLLIPPAGASGPTMIELDTSWRTRWLSAPETERGYMRTYTVSNSRLVPSVGLDETPLLGMFPAAEADLEPLARDLPAGLQPEIDVDFVLHTDAQGTSGPGSAWAEQAQVGQQVSILAPLRGSTLWSSYNPGAASSLLLLGDETAAPALLSILRSLPTEATGAVFLEVPGAEDALDRLPEVRQATQRVPGVRLHVLARTPGQMRGHQLTRALRTTCSLEPAPAVAPSDDWETDGPLWHLAENPTGTYVLIAGESTVVKTLRRICVNEAGLPKESISFMGYWKAGQAEG